MEKQEVFIICPSCGEEAFVAVRRGFNIVNCPQCDYFLIAYLDEAGQSWTREPGVLEGADREGK